ncbi:MAG: hypothetical protein FWD05_02870 [Oscillospiraceae bacterium]|nr:hypothetical protein [Oscillospiraceae bacterium]
MQVRAILSEAVLLGESEMFSGTIPETIPNTRTIFLDFIPGFFLLTILTHNFGWIPLVVTLSALLFFIIKITMRCMKQKSDLGVIVSIAIVLTFSIQVLSYIFTNFGFILFRGSLPLLSANPASMTINLALIGFMLSVFRTGDVVIDEKIAPVTKQRN